MEVATGLPEVGDVQERAWDSGPHRALAQMYQLLRLPEKQWSHQWLRHALYHRLASYQTFAVAVPLRTLVVVVAVVAVAEATHKLAVGAAADTTAAPSARTLQRAVLAHNFVVEAAAVAVAAAAVAEAAA